MKTKLIIVLLVISSIIMVVNSPAEAIPIGQSSFSSSATVINFDALPIGTAVDNEYSSLGVVFSSPGGGAGGLVVFLAPGQVLSVASSIIADFTVPVHKVGANYSSISPLTLEIYDSSNTLLESLTLSSSPGFLGLDSGGVLIAKAIIHDSGYGFTIDNFAFEDPVSQVAEPNTLLLLGSGLLGLGVLGRKRMRKD